MCRNIKKLRRPGRRIPTNAELTDASLQFVRKISGYRAPSEANREVFERTVAEIAETARRMFGQLQVRTPRKVA
jgi:hypothetical protein